MFKCVYVSAAIHHLHPQLLKTQVMAAVIRGARMALIALLLGVAGVEGSEFTASKPRLEARVALEKDRKASGGSKYHMVYLKDP